MKKIWLSAALACLCVSPAWADPPPAAAPPYRSGVSLQPVAIYDQAGNLVGSFGGNGSAGSVTAPGTSGSQAQAVQGINGGVPQNVTQAPTSTIAVQRTTGIGTTGVQVSATDAVNRRTVTNTSAIACELMGSAAAYGTGYPLPGGSSFTFDASGRTTAALFVACASSGGTVAVLSY